MSFSEGSGRGPDDRRGAGAPGSWPTPPGQGAGHPPQGAGGYPPQAPSPFAPPGPGGYAPPQATGPYGPPGPGAYPPQGPGGYPTGGGYPPPGPGGYPPPKRPTETFAVLGFVFSLLGGLLLSVVFSLVALSRIKRSGNRGRGFAIAGLVISGLWVVGLAVGGVLAVATSAERDTAGNVTDGGSVSQEELQVGDCLASVPDDGVVFSMDVVPCEQPHAAQVVAAHVLAEGDFPGEDAVVTQAEQGCVDRLDEDVIDRIADAELDLGYVYPTRRSWQADDRRVTCYVIGEPGPLAEPVSPGLPS